MGFRLSLAAVLVAGCTASGEQVRPPDDQIFFPSGVALAPGANAADPEPTLFVVSSNAELRYDTGSVVAVDLDVIDALIDTWLGGSVPDDPAGCQNCCAEDAFSHGTLTCDEAAAIVPATMVRTGNFSTDLVVQTLASGALRLLVPVRGDPSLTWIDYDPASGTLDCGGGGDQPICDDAHRLTRLRNDSNLPALASEPFGVFVDGGNQYGVLTHLNNGTVTLFDAPADGSPPVLVDALAGLFGASPTTGARSSVGVAGRTPGTPGDLIYVTSSTDARVQLLYVTRNAADVPAMAPADFFLLDRIFPSDNGRGIAFGAGGDRAYVVNRSPPTLQVVDTAIGTGGFPRNQVVDAIEICRDASVLAVGDLGEGERAYISCFSDGEVWVIDLDDGDLESIIQVGRGPHESALSVARHRLYVANYLEDTIAVIDVTPGAPTENRMVFKLGRERGEDQ